MHVEPRCKINEEVRAPKTEAKGRYILHNLVSLAPPYIHSLARRRFNEVITFNEKLCARSRGICFAR